MIEVVLANENHASSWEKFLTDSREPHHAFSWCWSRIIPEIFGHRPYMLMAVQGTGDSQTILGICPLYHVKSLLFGQALISVPYLNSGGILTCDEAARLALLSKVTELGKELGVRYVELRHVGQCEGFGSELPVRTHKVSMKLPLTSDPERLFSSFVPKLRSQIRRPSKAGLFAQASGIHLSNEESVSSFYSVFSEHMRDLGTPTYPKRLYALVQNQFRDRCRILTVWKGNEAVAAGLTIGAPWTDKETVEGASRISGTEIPWASSLRRWNKDSPNMLLYWEAMKTACIDGYGMYDFGRSSPDSGPYKFKAQWGAEPNKLHWYYRIFQGEMPDVNPNNPKYELMVRCWKHLPLPVANRLGAWLSKSIP